MYGLKVVKQLMSELIGTVKVLYIIKIEIEILENKVGDVDVVL